MKPPHISSPGSTPAQAQIVEAAGLVGFATGDVAMAHKALDALAAPYPDPAPLNALSPFNAGDHYDLLEAEALQGFCSGYDLAAGTAGVDGERVAAARDRLVTRVDHFRTLCFDDGGCTALLRGEPNNHAIKAFAALGTCAMALPDRASAAGDFNEALRGVDWLAHGHQGNLEGGWAESWNYLDYSGETHLGFLAAVHHVSGLVADGPWRVRGLGWITPSDPNKRDVMSVLDPAEDPLWRAVYTRALFAAMPWGRLPPVDDANPSAMHGGLLAALFDDARFLSNWELPAVGRHTGRQLVATFLTLDPAMAAEAPTWAPDGFFAEAGFSILRTSLSTTSSYLHMQHEGRQMRREGGAHEHADPLSIILAAHGTDLIIDPGYIDFTNHGKVKYGKDHNIVLVDGQGPEFFLDGLLQVAPNSDGHLHDHTVGVALSTFSASTKYAGAELRRRVARVVPVAGGAEVFVVADRLVADTTRAWTFQLNGLASEEIGGTSFTSTPTDTGARATWARPAASMHSIVAAVSGTATAGSRLEESSLAGGRHRCLTVDADMGAGAGFLSLLVPALPSATPELVAERRAGVLVLTATLDDGAIVTAYLNTGASAVTLEGAGAIAPGLSVVVSGTAAAATGTWTMDTPPIPDPEPFIPE